MRKSILVAGLMVSPLFFISACRPSSTVVRPWSAFLLDMSNLDRAARLDTAGTRLYSSFDPTGGNDNFNHYAGPGTEAGWVTLVDLEGPGCVRRFWTTGIDPGHPFKFYFDGEKTPRLSGTIDELFGERFPFQPPIARYQNNGWWSYVPIPFAKSLRIESKAPPVHPYWGPRKLFYQINAETYPRTSPVESFPREFSEADHTAWKSAAEAWAKSVVWPSADWSGTQPLEIAAGATSVIYSAQGPAVLRSLSLHVAPASPSDWKARDREYLLQDAVLAVFYDDAQEPSIHVPVGDFFGNAWRERNYGSTLLGCGTNSFVSHWPMPFAKSIRIELINDADRPVQVFCRAETTADRAQSKVIFMPCGGAPDRSPAARTRWPISRVAANSSAFFSA